MDKLVSYAWRGERLPLDGIIDMHTHMGTWIGFPIFGGDAESMVRQMDRVGVEKMFCSHEAVISSEVVHGNNEVLEAIRKFPGRILGYAISFPVNDRLGIDEIKRCIEQGMRGIKLHNHNNIPYTSPKYRKVWRFADENKLPVLLHTWGGLDRLEPLFKRYRNAKIILGHAGAVGAEEYVKYARKHKNVYLELCSSVSKYFLVEYFVREVPVRKILFGSDMPWMALGHQLGRVVFADISESQKKAILVDNPARVISG